MRLPKLAIAASLLSCGLTVAVLYHLNSRKTGEYWWFREQNDRMRFEAYQRHKASTATQEGKSAREEGKAAQAIPPTRPAGATTPASTGAQYGYHNAGLGTPAAAMQTFVWACDRSDTEMVARMLFMTPEEHRKAEQFLAAQPPEVRAKWASVEDLGAHLLILSSLGNSFPSAEVLAAAPVDMQGEERAICGVAQRVAFRKVGGEWRREVDSGTLEYLHREATRTLGAAPVR